MAIRSITTHDLDAVKKLLLEGFPRRSPRYWQAALSALAEQPEVDGIPKLGLLLQVDGDVEGVLLTIPSQRSGNRYCNLSSWFVRPKHRRHSIFMLRRAMREKDVVYLDMSPAPSILEAITKMGFVPYTGGTVLLRPGDLLSKGDARVKWLTAERIQQLGPNFGPIGQRLRQGCQGVLLEESGKLPEPALFRIKWLKKTVPAARFVYGDPERLVANAGPLLRALVRSGITFALIDAPMRFLPQHGRLLPMREVRYVQGGMPPSVGDLLDSEIALFGP